MYKKIVKISLAVVALAIVCFGIVFAVMYFSKSDAKSINSEFDTRIVGTWDAIACVDVNGKEVMPPEGNRFIFSSDHHLDYYQNSTLVDSYSIKWESESELTLTSLNSTPERTVTISFDEDGNMHVDDPTYKTIWSLKKSN